MSSDEFEEQRAEMDAFEEKVWDFKQKFQASPRVDITLSWRELYDKYSPLFDCEEDEFLFDAYAQTIWADRWSRGLSIMANGEW